MERGVCGRGLGGPARGRRGASARPGERRGDVECRFHVVSEAVAGMSIYPCTGSVPCPIWGPFSLAALGPAPAEW